MGTAKASCDQAASHYKPIGAQTNQGFTPGTSGLPGRWTGGGPAPKLRSYQETQQVLQIQAQAIATAEQMESERMDMGDVLWNTATGTAYEFFVADFVNCYEDPNILDCGAAAASLIPGYGKLGKAASVADDVVALASKGDELATVADDLAGMTDDVASKADDVATKSDNASSTLDDAACGLKSFEGDTQVLMADGTTKPIGEVRVGDRVMAEDPETGERGPRTVTHVWVHGDDLVDFRIADDVVTTTEDHPFWNATDGTWQGPEEFDAGDRVLTADGNLLVTGGLVASSWHTGSAFNLTVEGIHTYYVVVADEAVLVHNCPGGAFGSMLPGVNAGNVKKLNNSEVERILGQDAHSFKKDMLTPGAAISKFDIGVGDDGMVYLINKSSGGLVETGVSAVG